MTGHSANPFPIIHLLTTGSQSPRSPAGINQPYSVSCTSRKCTEMHKQCPPRISVLPQRLSHVRSAAFNAQAPSAAGTLPPSPSPRRSYERPSHQCKGAPARGFPHKEIFDGQCIKRFSPQTHRIQLNRNGIFFSNGREVLQVHVPLLRRRQRRR